MMTVAALGAADVASGVLIAAGVAKLREPASFAVFLSSVGLRTGRGRGELIARTVGSVEIALAAAALAVGGAAWFGALGLLYLGLAAVSAINMTRPAPSCGCFGAASAPTTASHIVLDLAFAVGSIAAAVDGAAPLVDRLGAGVTSAAYLFMVALAIALAVTVMTTAAELTSVRRSMVRVDPRPRPARR